MKLGYLGSTPLRLLLCLVCIINGVSLLVICQNSVLYTENRARNQCEASCAVDCEILRGKGDKGVGEEGGMVYGSCTRECSWDVQASASMLRFQLGSVYEKNRRLYVARSGHRVLWCPGIYPSSGSEETT